MPTVIDSLVVKLGLDSTDFEAGQKKVGEGLDKTEKVAEKTGKDIEESGKKAASFFGQIEKAAIRFFAVLTVGRGLADFTRNVVNTGAELSRVSQRIGTSADVLSRWQGAVRQSGGSAEGFLTTVQGLSNSLTELKLTGNTGILPYLQALGVSVADTEGKARPIEQIITDIGDKLNKLPSKGDAFNIGRNLGFDDGTINLLLKGRTEVERLLAAQKGYSDADARAALDAQEKWEGVKLRIERMTQEIVIKLLPALERITTLMEQFATVATPILIQITDAFIALDKATGGWSTTLLACLATLRLITGMGIVGALGRGGPVALAGYGGYKAGEYINDKLVSGTSFGNKVGEYAARALAFLGNKDAQSAVDAADGKVKTADGALVVPATNVDATGSASGNTRAERNNNPGNLEFRGQAGAVPENGTGRFAKFTSAAEGVSALVKQLQRYGSRGMNTIGKIINTYAPANENDTKAYIAAISKRLGVGADQELDLNNADTLAGLVKGISKHESGSDYLSDRDVMSGLQMAGVNGGKQGAGASMNIGEVKVYTQATDAGGIARDMKAALIRQADQGVR